MKKVFTLNRDAYGQDAKGRETTLGFMTDPCGDHFCYVLEDVVRAFGVKRKKTTAIPATGDDFEYKMTVRKSPRYGEVVVIYTREESGIYYLERGGISFEMILAHGGNHADHTEGCLLVNTNRETKDGIMAAWGSMKDEFAREVQMLESQGFDVRLRIVNGQQEG